MQCVLIERNIQAKFNDKNGYGSEVTTVKLHAVLEYGLEVNGFYRLRLEWILRCGGAASPLW